VLVLGGHHQLLAAGAQPHVAQLVPGLHVLHHGAGQRHQRPHPVGVHLGSVLGQIGPDGHAIAVDQDGPNHSRQEEQPIERGLHIARCHGFPGPGGKGSA